MIEKPVVEELGSLKRTSGHALDAKQGRLGGERNLRDARDPRHPTGDTGREPSSNTGHTGNEGTKMGTGFDPSNDRRMTDMTTDTMTDAAKYLVRLEGRITTAKYLVRLEGRTTELTNDSDLVGLEGRRHEGTRRGTGFDPSNDRRTNDN